MIIVPKEKPVLANLNSYYLNFEKLVEHFQGEIGAGAVFFKSAVARAVIFFDPDNIVNVYFQHKKEFFQGKKARETLNQAAYNFIVDVYQFELEQVYFWAQIPVAKNIYKNLNTKSNNFNKLLKKIAAEKFTGFSEVILNNKLGEGLIFFNDGEIIGGSCALPERQRNSSWQPDELLKMITESGAVFSIFSLSFQNRGKTLSEQERQPPEPAGYRIDILKALEELIHTFEGIIRKEKSYDSGVLIRKKIIDKSDKYDFLDPFVSEFSYKDGRINFTGSVDDSVLAQAVVEVILELADDLGKREHFLQRLHFWRKKYGADFVKIGIRL